jgi:hypothetical protein
MGEQSHHESEVAAQPEATAEPCAAPRQRWLGLFVTWTAPQRGVIIGLLVAILIYLAVRWWLNPLYVSDPQPRDPPRAVELADRIDPNTADWQTLAALPIIGQKRAREIVAYREKFVANNPGKLAFARIDDLYRMKGFGTAIVAQIEPYLIFPRQPPTTRP